MTGMIYSVKSVDLFYGVIFMDEKKTKVVNGIGYRFCEECQTWRTFKELPLEDEVCEYCLSNKAILIEKARRAKAEEAFSVNQLEPESLVLYMKRAVPRIRVSLYKDGRIYFSSFHHKKSCFGYIEKVKGEFVYRRRYEAPYLEAVLQGVRGLKLICK